MGYDISTTVSTASNVHIFQSEAMMSSIGMDRLIRRIYGVTAGHGVIPGMANYGINMGLPGAARGICISGSVDILHGAWSLNIWNL